MTQSSLCLSSKSLVKPDISKSAWPPPASQHQFDYDLEGDLEAMCPDHDGAGPTSHPSLPDLGDQSVSFADIELRAQPPNLHQDTDDDDVAGPAPTLHARFSAVRSPANK